MTYRIGTRGSALALVQTELVRTRLVQAFPEDSFEVVPLVTRGDRERERSIAALGDNALFTGEIERALAEGRIDLAVHSLKDLPSTCAAGLTLAKAWPREDPRDVLVAKGGAGRVEELPPGAVVATGSPRRSLLLRRKRPDLKVVEIRGNVETRLRKLFAPEAGEPALDALVLAAAGLRRLGRREAACPLDPAWMIPAANQGTLAIEVREADANLKAKLDALGDDTAEAVARAERGFLRELGVDCHRAVGAFATVSGGRLRLRGLFARDAESPPFFGEAEGPVAEAEAVARAAADEVRRQAAGVVTLVGAGPGDADLITVRGLRALREADAIVYDRLIPQALLSEAKAGCELVSAGKASGRHTLPQEEINALLARLALVHDRVVRLKGGDPFVFGRGGEEAAYLSARRIRCRVVPGVSSAVAAAGAVGVPVTHRGLSNGFVVVTAHARSGSGGTEAPLDYSRLTDETKTAVFLMGLGRIGEIAQGLRAVGRAATTPAVVISAATTAQQRSVWGTLEDIAGRVARAGLVSPAVLVVGAVASLRGRTGLPLAGRRCFVAHIGDGPSKVERLLRELGAEVESRSVGRIVPIAGATAGVDWAAYGWVAFTSRHGILSLDEGAVGEIRRRGLRCAVVGAATAEAVKARGLAVDWVSAGVTGREMREGLREVVPPTERVLWIGGEEKAKGEGEVEEEKLKGEVEEEKAKGEVEKVAVYRNEAVAIERIDLGAYEAAFFTCGSAARRVMAAATGETRAVAIGESTRAALAAAGARTVVVAARPTPEALVEAAFAVSFAAPLTDF